MKKIVKNSIYGLIGQVITVIMSMIIQRMIINRLGIEYQGLNTVMNSMVSILALVELGLGTSIVFSLYEPLLSNDYGQISSLIHFFKRLYILIIIGILVVGLLLLPLCPSLIKDSVFDAGYIRWMFFLFILKTACSYIGAEYFSLLFADQRNYIAIKYRTCIGICSQVTQIVIIYTVARYEYMVFSLIVTTIVTNICIALKTKALYPYLSHVGNGELSPAQQSRIKSDVKELSVSKIVDMLIFQTDALIISKFIGEITVAVYSNYLLIVQGMNTFITCITQGIQPTLTRYIMERKKENNDYEKVVGVYYMCFVFLATMCFTLYFALFNDVISLWIGAEYILDNLFVLCVAFSQFLLLIDQPIWMLCYCSGMFKEIRKTGIIVACVNIIVSLSLVGIIGITGVVIGTIICCITSNTLYLIIVSRINDIKKGTIRRYTLYWVLAIAETAMMGFIITTMEKRFDSVFPLSIIRVIIKAVIYMLMITVINISVFSHSDCLKNTLGYIKSFGMKKRSK